MQRLVPALVLALLLGAFLWLLGISVIAATRQRRRSRFRILSQGRTAEALITSIAPESESDRCRVSFSFQPELTGPRIEGTQQSTLAAVKALGLAEGSQVRVHYLPKSPRCAFIDALAVAERIAAVKTTAAGRPLEAPPPSVYFISYGAPVRRTPAANAFRWSGDGDITIAGEVVRFTAQRARPFWFPKVTDEEFPRSAIANVEVFDNTVRCEITARFKIPRALQFWAVNAQEAKAIGASLPASRTSTFVPQLAERAAFNARLLEVTPRAPITPVLIGVNVVMFLIAAALGGGIFVPNAEVMIRLGSDYTPLTAAGEWWRLLTSTFLHFGILHLAFNMWALWVNGVLVERLYGSTRYLMLYLVAGVAGSVTSFLWHPFVNGAGASGAIFGVLGALFAYFLRTDSGVPQSVLKAQRNAAGIFIVVSLLNASRVKGIDNAAHLGGVAAGFLMGWLLCRPLDARRDEEDWTGQWMRAFAVVLGSVLFVGYYLSSGQWHPRMIHDASGRPVSFAELAPPPRTFDGVTLGMTSDELLRVKGKPIHEERNAWAYTSGDPPHCGILDVYLSERSDRGPARVWGVLFVGKADAEPAGVSDLMGFTRQDLLVRYGVPAGEYAGRPGSQYVYFHNGILVWLDADKVRAYGVWERRQ
jgi:membrane associated rhomboid family serine protease